MLLRTASLESVGGAREAPRGQQTLLGREGAPTPPQTHLAFHADKPCQEGPAGPANPTAEHGGIPASRAPPRPSHQALPLPGSLSQRPLAPSLLALFGAARALGLHEQHTGPHTAPAALAAVAAANRATGTTWGA